MPTPNDEDTVAGIVASVVGDSDDAPESQEPETQPQDEQTAPDATPSDDVQAPSAEPFLARLKAAGVRQQDIEQASRYYQYKAENEKLQKELQEARGRDPWKIQADSFIQSIEDAGLREQHERYRAYHGDRKYLMDLERQQSQPEPDMQPTPQEEPDENAKLRQQVDELTKWKTQYEAREKEQRFKGMVDAEFNALNVPEYCRERLFASCKAQALAHLQAGRYQIRVADLVKAEWEGLEAILSSHAKNATESLRKAATAAPKTKPPVEPGKRMNPPDLEEEETVQSILSKSLPSALDSVMPEGDSA